MKVSHIDAVDTHAVIGGSKVRQFSIAQTPEFYELLSNALYSNKPLAVVREVLCNAWDIHIASGKTHIPIRITLNDEKLVIRDFGTGISDDKIEDIYCTYGNSTKENDGLQTGGFGLGSKAPFAYTEHFTVTSFFNHQKIVYAVSRGSELTGGKPDIRVMVSIPTTETGLEVNIPIKKKEDVGVFAQYIRDITKFGEMNVMFNDNILPVIPISKAEDNLYLTSNKPINNNDNIFVRYGNVIYPVPKHNDYIGLYRSITDRLSDIPSNNEYSYNKLDWNIILQAQPNSISVTPSRENLSMTQTTISTVTQLLTDISSVINFKTNNFKKMMLEYEDYVIDQAYRYCQPQALLTEESVEIAINEYNSKKVSGDKPTELTSIRDVANYMAAYSRDIDHLFKELRFKKRINSLIQGQYPRKQDLVKYLRYYNYMHHDYYWKRPPLFNHKFFKPLLKKLWKDPDLNPKNMMVAVKSHARGSTQGYVFTNLSHYYPARTEAVDLLRGVVVLAYGKISFAEYYKNTYFNKNRPLYLYICNRKEGQKDKAKAFFEKEGYIVDDFAERHEAFLETLPKPTPVAKVDKIPKVKGIPSMMNLITNTTHYHSFNPRGHRSNDHTISRIEKPEFIFQPHSLSGSDWNQKFFRFGDKAGEAIVKLFGSKGGIVANEVQYKAYIAKGAKPGYDWLIENLFNELNNNPRLRNYFANKNESKSEHLGYYSALGKICENSSIIQSKLNLPASINDHDSLYLTVYNALKDEYENSSGKLAWITTFQLESEKIKTLKPSKEVKNLNEIIKNRRVFLDSIDLSNMSSILEKPSVDINLRTFIEVSIINALGV